MEGTSLGRGGGQSKARTGPETGVTVLARKKKEQTQQGQK